MVSGVRLLCGDVRGGIIFIGLKPSALNSDRD
jgi:hypothetical protein